MTSNLEELLSRANDICQREGVRFTPLRQRVFELMAQQGGAISAYDLLDKLKLTEKSAKPPTVYRALDFLLENSFIHKIESTNAFILCPHFGTQHPMQLLICDDCGTVIELHDEVIDTSFSQQAVNHGFAITNKTIEAHGLCANCCEQ